MNRVYTASDFSYELQRTLPQCNYTLDLLSLEFDLLLLEGPILELINKKVNVTLVISALDQKKSLRIVNLFNRIIHAGGVVYWSTEKEIYENDVHFAVLDKEIAIKKSDFFSGEGTQEKLVFLNQLFDSSRAQAKQIELLTGQIAMNFITDKSYVKRNDEITLTWEVKNAHSISLKNHIENVEPVGSTTIQIKEDSVFKLEAFNRDGSIEKELIVQVIKSNELEVTLEAYDTTLQEYVTLKSIEENNHIYIAFYQQNIRLSWVSNSLGKLSEKLLGSLSQEGDHNFILSQTSTFTFKFESIYGTQYTQVELRPVTEKVEEESTLDSPALFERIFRYFKKTI